MMVRLEPEVPTTTDQERSAPNTRAAYLMRWSLPPSQYYAEDRLSFGEPSWKTLRLLVSIWVRTLSIF
ncbi:hypothetical protein E5P22_19205, partial [Escherichia coli]